jgi:hypothetical protein
MVGFHSLVAHNRLLHTNKPRFGIPISFDKHFTSHDGPRAVPSAQAIKTAQNSGILRRY